MRPTSKTVLTDSVKITEVGGVKMERFVKADGSLCLDNEKAYGVSQVDADCDEMCPVDVYGIVIIEAGDGVDETSIPIGAPVTSDAFGKAKKNDSVSIFNHNGFAVTGASASGIGLAIKLA